MKKEIKSQILEMMIAESSKGVKKDEIIFKVMGIELCPPSVYESLWKESGMTKSGGSGYRQRTIAMFLETDGLVTQKEWEVEMIDGGFLKKIVNYRQHFVTFYCLYHHISFDEYEVHSS